MEYPICISFRCDADVERRARIEAARRDMNRTEFIVEALREKLERIDAESAQDPSQPNT